MQQEDDLSYERYDVLSRRLRPKNFQEFLGSESLRFSLQYALLRQKLASAYLFTGIRGTGKTSMARIFAKAINCETLAQQIHAIQQHPVYQKKAIECDAAESDQRKQWITAMEPCNTCASCLDIIKSKCVDVLEIDAASNRGIEHIRELREKVYYAPQLCRFKVYIIDEAHMLTNESFNALLKTLEEPPAHVKFILASTEIKKIPATIVSRCLCYDFAVIPERVMANKIHEILAKQNSNLSNAWVELIVQKSGGSMRDALSALEMALSVSETDKTEQALSHLLGYVDYQQYFQLTDAVFEQNPSLALQALHEILRQGVSMKNFISDWLEVLRLILVAQQILKDDIYWRSYWSKSLDAIYALAQKISATKLQRIFDLLLDMQMKAYHLPFEKRLLEVWVLRAVAVEDMIGVKELIRALIKTPAKPLDTPEQKYGESLQGVKKILDGLSHAKQSSADGADGVMPADAPASFRQQDAVPPAQSFAAGDSGQGVKKILDGLSHAKQSSTDGADGVMPADASASFRQQDATMPPAQSFAAGDSGQGVKKILDGLSHAKQSSTDGADGVMPADAPASFRQQDAVPPAQSFAVGDSGQEVKKILDGLSHAKQSSTDVADGADGADGVMPADAPASVRQQDAVPPAQSFAAGDSGQGAPDAQKQSIEAADLPAVKQNVDQKVAANALSSTTTGITSESATNQQLPVALQQWYQFLDTFLQSNAGLSVDLCLILKNAKWIKDEDNQILLNTVHLPDLTDLQEHFAILEKEIQLHYGVTKKLVFMVNKAANAYASFADYQESNRLQAVRESETVQMITRTFPAAVFHIKLFEPSE